MVTWSTKCCKSPLQVFFFALEFTQVDISNRMLVARIQAEDYTEYQSDGKNMLSSL